jgi:hypothetical protein|tara:strand:+ start:930 stop:1967 length:1038 start_codon:yes stop_codon:yes gene_type:complete
MLTQVVSHLELIEDDTSANDYAGRLETFEMSWSRDGKTWFPYLSTSGTSLARTFTHGGNKDGSSCSDMTTTFCNQQRTAGIKTSDVCYPMSLDGQSSCPFRLGAESPCFHNDCISGEKSDACLLVTNTYCESETTKKKSDGSYSLDPACSPSIFVGVQCAYRVTSAGDALFSPPCSDVTCASTPLSKVCRTVILNHCKTASVGNLDPGCLFSVHSIATTTSLSAAKCTFSFEKKTSPCHHIACRSNGMSDTSCREYVRDYCKISDNAANDAGCIKLTQQGNIDVDLVCAFDDSKNESPCNEKVCRLAVNNDPTSENIPLSQACREKIQNYCNPFTPSDENNAGAR